MPREWIEHNGEGIPVAAHERVDVMCRGFDGDMDHADAGCFQFNNEDWWIWSGRPTDIVKYRKAHR